MPTRIIEIANNAFPHVRIPPGTFVVWHNKDGQIHSAETLRTSPLYFNAGAMFPGDHSSPVIFEKEGRFDYVCRFHSNMGGTVEVTRDANHGDHPGHGDNSGGHGGHGLHHYHGFVTGGRSPDAIYMSHTPVLADKRHSYQVILRGHFVKPEHGEIYRQLRESEYGDKVVQIFHDHMSMPDIGNGKIKELPSASISYWPGGTQTTIGPQQIDIPGLEENVPIAIDEVIHFHEFDTEGAYPGNLTYIMYGDDHDVFIDHFIKGAPSFHSVAKVKPPASGWHGRGTTSFSVPFKSMRHLEPRTLSRFAIVDNAFHLAWLPPPGGLIGQAQDPLIVRGPAGARHAHPVEFSSGEKETLEVVRFLHFDIRLLNYGVLIV
nr:hypothetical protein [uncultured Dongia sp.]